MQISATTRKVGFFLIQLIISAGALYWFFSRIQLDRLWMQLADVQWSRSVAAFGMFCVGLLICAVRWVKVARACGYSLSAGDLTVGYLIGFFFNAFLPTVHGGDVMRGIWIARKKGISTAGLLGTIVVERAIGFIAALVFMICAGLIMVLRVQAVQNMLLPAILLLLILIVPIVVLAQPRVRAWVVRLLGRIPIARFREALMRLVEVFESSVQSRSMIIWAFALSFLNQLVLIVSGIILAGAVPDFDSPLIGFPFVIPMVCVAGLIPSIGGYGVREAGYMVGFQLFGVSAEAAATFGIIQLVFIRLISVAGSFVFVATRIQAAVRHGARRAEQSSGNEGAPG